MLRKISRPTAPAITKIPRVWSVSDFVKSIIVLVPPSPGAHEKGSHFNHARHLPAAIIVERIELSHSPNSRLPPILFLRPDARGNCGVS